MRHVFVSMLYVDPASGSQTYADGTYGYEGKFDVEEFNKLKADFSSKAGVLSHKLIVLSILHLEK